eukprot:TRINITY_DN6847_c0_g1_i1.p1 TRINITY_DN6847_c0_g1~~TRINITY_DN6847_c0_g1_i1.p1  ORF type:complete len:183 (+),score=25.86 TRINITY_DN6847_c0_g1_i1:54-602(+)
MSQDVRHGVLVKYQYETRSNGVMNYVVTKGGKVMWQHPVKAGVVTINASSVEGGNLGDVCDLYPSEQKFVTQDVPYSWVSFTFKTCRVRPTHYKLGLASPPPPSSWHLHGSTDGINWIILKIHTNDPSLAICTEDDAVWSLTPVPAGAYRHFRILLQKEGSQASTSALSFSSFEVYGEVFKD